MIDPSLQAADQVAPVFSSVSVTDIKRGQGPQQSGCGESATSCDDIGIVTLVLHASDDTTSPEHIGYRLTLQSGTLPAGLMLPADAVEPGFDDRTLLLVWIDGNSDDQESFDFTLRVVAIDLAGNESAAQTVRVSDERGMACAVAAPHRAPRAPFLVAVLGLVLGWAAGRRRRRPVR